MPTATTLASPMLRPEGVLIGSVGLNGTRQTLWISRTPGARISEKGVLRTHRGCWFGAGCQGRDRPPSGPAVSAVGQAATRSSSTRILVNELRMKATTVRLNEPRPT